MACEQPWFLTRVVPDMDSSSQLPLQKWQSVLRSLCTTRRFSQEENNTKKVGFLPRARGQRIFVLNEAVKPSLSASTRRQELILVERTSIRMVGISILAARRLRRQLPRV